MKQIIFSDIDGTLLNDQHQMMELTRDAIIKVQNNNIPFVIISARSPSGIYPILEKNKLKCTIIAYSGGMILDSNREVIYQQGMDAKLAVSIINYLEEQKYDLAWNVYSFDQWFVKNRQDKRVQREERIVETTSKVVNIDQMKQLTVVHKILCICNQEQILEIEQQLKDKFPECMIVKSSNILLEIMIKDTSKAAAVKKLCDLWNFDITKAIAFGDQYNDLEMLQTVGYGYAMANAPAEIREIVGRVTLDNNHDGIYDALEKLKLL